MKKTIAKLMAAAMLLSAVPAVTMPSFVSKAGSASAATNTTTVSSAQNFVQGGDLIPTKAGELFQVRVTLNDLNDPARFGAATYGGVKGTLADALKPSVVGTGGATAAFTSLVNVDMVQNSNDSSVYTIKVSPKANMTTSEKSTFVDAIRKGNNCFRIKLSLAVNNNNAAAGSNGNWDQDATFKAYLNQGYVTFTGDKVYWIGGQYDNGMIREMVIDDDNLLATRNVYAKIDKVTSDNMAELELIKQANNEVNKLKDNDTLRGRTLNLTTLKIGGVEYKVGKLGAQCLKEAKMKKLLAKNVSKVYKGALRKCKQVKTVNMKDKNKIRKINTEAFYNCKNLKHIIIDGRKLNSVGKDSFTGLKKNCTVKIKASKSKFNADVKKIKKANPKAAGKLKFARIAP
jgi:hypothetical protein